MASLTEQEQRELGKTLRTLAEKIDPRVAPMQPPPPIPVTGPMGAKQGPWKQVFGDDFAAPRSTSQSGAGVQAGRPTEIITATTGTTPIRPSVRPDGTHRSR